MSDPFKLSRAALDDEIESPLCKSIIDGTHKSVRPRPSRDDRVISDLEMRVKKLETASKRAPKKSNGITRRDFEMLTETLGDVLGQTLNKEFAAISQRLDELERRPSLAYRGAWIESCAYARGSFVSHQGSIWHSNEDQNASRPGVSDAWTLAVKRGQRAPTGTRPHNGADR